MPRAIVFRGDVDRYLDKAKIRNHDSIWDRVVNLVSDPFESISNTFNAVNKKYRPITFFATLSLSTWLTSAIVKTGVDSLYHWNFSLLSKEAFLANGTAGLWSLPTAIAFYIGMSLLNNGTVSFPDERVSASQIGRRIGMGYYFLRLTPPIIQNTLNTILKNQFIFGISDTISQIALEDTSVDIPGTNKRIKVAPVIAALATFYFGGAYSYLKSYF